MILLAIGQLNLSVSRYGELKREVFGQYTFVLALTQMPKTETTWILKTFHQKNVLAESMYLRLRLQVVAEKMSLN